MEEQGTVPHFCTTLLYVGSKISCCTCSSSFSSASQEARLPGTACTLRKRGLTHSLMSNTPKQSRVFSWNITMRGRLGSNFPLDIFFFFLIGRSLEYWSLAKLVIQSPTPLLVNPFCLGTGNRKSVDCAMTRPPPTRTDSKGQIIEELATETWCRSGSSFKCSSRSCDESG